MTTHKLRYTMWCVFGMLSLPLAADTIKLKSGTEYKGKILSEDDTSYLIEIKHSASIKDERRIPKDQILEITKDSKDNKDFQSIKSMIPVPDLLEGPAYAKRIERAETFLKKHPKSSHKKEVQTILETLKKEQQLISSGGIKLSGHLISAEDIKTNAYDIQARILSEKIKKRAKSGQYPQALRLWEKLQNQYAHSAAYQDGISWIPRVLRAHQSELQQHLDTLDARLKKQQKVLESLADSDRDRAEKLITEKKNRYEATIDREQNELKSQWLTINPFHEQALQYNLRSVESELRSLESKPASSIRLAGPDLRSAWTALAGGKLSDAERHLQAALSLKIDKQYTDPIKAELEQKKAEQAEAKAAEEQAQREAEELAAKEKAAQEAEEKNKGKKGKKKKTKKTPPNEEA
ncbi:hypothetical protein HW115_12880 [Verrucomicrobiaceae bacterium N1E253]|uniref:Uncharacterized protein n=1 Tax=Oceaniferula marina TaxID=2748318 RepID=A0A851GFH2_9BACT|nr:PTPDL family protein [Oceaniferula marina]NWK56508.1 hypothetical protein [Oceaniferula marina]